MARTVGIGIQNFAKLMENHYFYVDKTDFIREWWESGDDVKSMNAYMNRVALATFSYFDSGRNPSMETQPERFYHGFVLGLAVELADRYIITSNRESGFGRYNVMMEPKNETDPAMIMEFKVRDPGEERSLEDTANGALKQIEEQQYETDLESRGIPCGRIRKYGFAFDGKKVLIKEYRGKSGE